MKTTIFFLAILLFVGCSSKEAYKMSVSAITLPSYHPTGVKSYTIKPMNESLDSLYFARYSQLLDVALSSLGYEKVFSSSLAKESIYMDYGVHESQKIVRPNINWGFTLGYPWGYRHPFYGNIGYDFYHQNYTTLYNRYLSLLAKDASGKELWRVDVSSYGESNKIGEILPKLIEGAKPYIGKDLKEPIKVVIKEKDETKKESN